MSNGDSRKPDGGPNPSVGGDSQRTGAPGGDATTDALLAGIPEEDRSGAALSLLQALPGEQKIQLFAEAVNQSDPGVQEATTSELFGRLDTPQKAAQVVQGMTSLPAPELGEAVGAGLQRLPAPELEKAAGKALSQLPADAKERVAGGLSAPDPKTNNLLWRVVVYSLIGIVGLFGAFTFVLIYQGKSAEAVLALATTALGGIVGLITPAATRGSG